MAVALGRLTVDDNPSAVFSDGTGSSSESSHGHSSSIQVLRRERLNQFLRICGKEECVTGQPKKRWGDMDEQRKSVYVHRATTAIVVACSRLSVCGERAKKRASAEKTSGDEGERRKESL